MHANFAVYENDSSRSISMSVARYIYMYMIHCLQLFDSFVLKLVFYINLQEPPVDRWNCLFCLFPFTFLMVST